MVEYYTTSRVRSNMRRRTDQTVLHHNTSHYIFHQTKDIAVYGQSVPAPWWFGRRAPCREVRPEPDFLDEGGPRPPTGPVCVQVYGLLSC